MTREEQIWDEACHRYADSKMRNAFVAAANWADSHPAWVSVEERLPKHNEEENGLITYEEVLVCLNDGYVTTDCYDDTRKKWLGYNGDVEYWVPTPQPPRKED